MKEMVNKKLLKEIERLKKEISGYPVGSISGKMINGKVRYYHQWYESGKTRSKYLKQDEVETFRNNIELRRIAEKKLYDLEQQVKNLLNKDLKAGISIPIEITGSFDGRCIIPDSNIRLSSGQKILVTIHDAVDKQLDINLDKYINQGEKLFPEDAQKYIRELRDEERI